MDIKLIDELLEKNGVTYEYLIDTYARDYLYDNLYFSDILQDMDDGINEFFHGKDPMEIIYSVNAGYDYVTEKPFNINAPYFILNGYDNPVSVDMPETEYYLDIIDKNDFITWCINNDYLETEIETE